MAISNPNGTRKNDPWFLVEQSDTLQTQNQETSDGQVLGHMGSGPPEFGAFAGIKPKRLWRRLEEQISTQGGQNEKRRDEPRYLFTVFTKNAGGEKLRRLTSLIVKSLINLIDASR